MRRMRGRLRVKASISKSRASTTRAAITAAIEGGSLELRVGDLISGVNAIVAGVPILLLAGSGLYLASAPINILAVAKDSSIRKPRDLTGKSIGVPTLVGITTAALRAWLPQNGVDMATVKVVEIPQSAVVPALQRGTLDCALLAEPFVTPSRGEIRDIGHPFDIIGKQFLLSVWYARRDWIEADRDRAKRAVAAIYDTARWANAHHADTFAILVREGQLDAEKLHGLTRTTYATSLTPAMVQPVLDIATQYKIFNRPVEADTLIARI